MKNILEKVAIAIVVLLTLLVVGLIAKFNMINDGDVSDNSAAYEDSVEKKESKKEKTSNYLQNLETYTDVDVKVDPTKVNNTNRVHVKSELTDNTMQSAIKDTDKSGYVNSLTKYTDKPSRNKKDRKKTDQELKDEKAEDDKVKLEQEEIEDDIGNAIGAALE